MEPQAVNIFRWTTILEVIICSLMHLMVDGLCICALYLVAAHHSTSSLQGVFLTYNILAFLSQPITGLWADRMQHRHKMLLTAVLLMLLTVLAASVVNTLGSPATGMVVVAILAGVGNSLFHVWGGKLVAAETGNEIRALGTFVATGAFGLSLGMVFYSWALLHIFLLALCLLAVVCLSLDARNRPATGFAAAPYKFSHIVVWGSVLALMVAVMLRSFVGQAFTSGITEGSVMVLLAGFLSMMGKMAGGWLVRLFGIIPMLIMVVLVMFACLWFSDQGVAMLLVGLFAVNCTMPVTLYLANLVLPGREGLAFGLLAAALIPGYLLAFL